VWHFLRGLSVTFRKMSLGNIRCECFLIWLSVTFIKMLLGNIRCDIFSEDECNLQKKWQWCTIFFEDMPDVSYKKCHWVILGAAFCKMFVCNFQRKCHTNRHIYKMLFITFIQMPFGNVSHSIFSRIMPTVTSYKNVIR
jgi:hypothetical protein